MGTKSVKVKTLADKYGVSVKEIIKELESQGFGDDVKSASSVIPPDAVELVKSYLDELMAKRGGEPGRGAGNRDGGGAVSRRICRTAGGSYQGTGHCQEPCRSPWKAPE